MSEPSRLSVPVPGYHDMKLELWGDQCLSRVFSLVNGGGQIETDLFAGLR